MSWSCNVSVITGNVSHQDDSTEHLHVLWDHRVTELASNLGEPPKKYIERNDRKTGVGNKLMDYNKRNDLRAGVGKEL